MLKTWKNVKDYLSVENHYLANMLLCWKTEPVSGDEASADLLTRNTFFSDCRSMWRSSVVSARHSSFVFSPKFLTPTLTYAEYAK